MSTKHFYTFFSQFFKARIGGMNPTFKFYKRLSYIFPTLSKYLVIKNSKTINTYKHFTFFFLKII